ncbi:MAG: major capsid protein [Clostridia bacterium]
MGYDIYSTAILLKAIELMPREYSFLYDTFIQDMGAVEDDKAIYDFRKGTRTMAPVVHAGTGGVLMQRNGYETREIGFCTIAPERIVTMADITGRAFGENVMGAMTPEQRAKKVVAADYIDMRKAIQRRREWMARQVLLTGMLNMFRYTSEGRDLQTTKFADYGFTNNFTPSTPWNQASANIDSDMRSMNDLVYEGSGVVDIIVMAPDVADAMIANGKYIKQFDYRNVNMGEINTKYKGQGVRFVGFNSDGVDMYSLSGKFVDDDGITKPVMPSGKMIVGSRAIAKCLHGPVTQVESLEQNALPKTYIKAEVPLRVSSIDGNTVKNRLTSCPTIVPYNVDAWCVASVL